MKNGFFAAFALAFACGCQWSQATPWGGDAGTSAPPSEEPGEPASGPAASAPEDAGAFPSGASVDASLLDAGPATALAAGGQHTCAVTSAGTVWCWGSNVDAQLGSSTGAGSLVAFQVTGAGAHAVAVAAGDEHTCALSLNGAVSEVQCWGANDHGQLGGSGLARTPVPVSVSRLSGDVTAIAAGGFHTCALAGGAVSCWGDGADGQLGSGSTTDSAMPVAVTGLSGVTAIAAGGAHTCALTSGGGVKCWGLNSYGQLGDGTTSNRTSPVSVSGLDAGVIAIATGNAHTCALTSAGGVTCWGFGLYGQLGNGGIANSSVPVAVGGLSATTAIAAGGTHTCALASGGAVSCWGDDQSGQLGDNSATDSPQPVSVTGLAAGASALTAGTAHTCAITEGGAAQCWGWNVAGQLGNDTLVDSPTPVSVLGF